VIADRDELRALIRLVMEQCAVMCDAFSEAQWQRFKKAPLTDPSRGNPYVEGESDGAHTSGCSIRQAAKDLK